MLESLFLRNYKGFDDFRIGFGATSVLVGPNNAGKSTCIEALRGVAAMVAHARRLKPDPGFKVDKDVQVRAYGFTAGQFGVEEENLRYEFNPNETRLELRLKGGSVVRAIWPPDDSGRGRFFYVTVRDALQPKIPAEVRPLFPAIGVLPQLSPVERTEEILTQKYLATTLSTRLSSRHFRNHLWQLSQEPGHHGDTQLDDFRRFAATWLPEIELADVRVQPGRKGSEIDVFYKEGRSQKELVWAGDGVQVFLQLLWHVHRLSSYPTIIMDEPDVYLHPDLQRRLLRLLETIEAQVIIATHSAEIMTEAAPTAVVWMDRSTKRAIRAPDGKELDDLSQAIGSHFNLRLARVLKAKAAVFVEGQDARLLRNLAATCNATAFVNEGPLTVVALDGAANRHRLDGFKWVVENLLGSAIHGWIILDRDFRSSGEIASLSESLSEAGLRPHIWQRHEIESYLLHPAAIARRSGASRKLIDELLVEVTDGMRDEVLPMFIGARSGESAQKHRAVGTVAAACVEELSEIWKDPTRRLAFCPAKEVVSHLNGRLQVAGFKTVTAYGLSKELRSDEIDPELRDLLHRIQHDSLRSDSN